MFNIVKKDIKRYIKIEMGVDTDPSILSLARLIVDNAGIQATLIYRFGRFINGGSPNNHLSFLAIFYPLYKLLYWFSRKALGIDLSLNADIGEGFYIGHFGGVVIEECNIGKNCSIHQQVKIHFAHGRISSIGNNVWLGAHCIIEPGVTIGSGSTVAAGAYVDKNFDPRVLIMGSPARVISKDYDNSNLL